jgi:hypothetical protein
VVYKHLTHPEPGMIGRVIMGLASNISYRAPNFREMESVMQIWRICRQGG